MAIDRLEHVLWLPEGYIEVGNAEGRDAAFAFALTAKMQPEQIRGFNRLDRNTCLQRPAGTSSTPGSFYLELLRRGWGECTCG